MSTITVKARAQEIVRAKYPQALEVATGRQIWIQSAHDGLAISDAYTFEKSGRSAAKMAWCSAAKNVNWMALASKKAGHR